MASKSKRPPKFTNPPPSDSSSDEEEDEEVHPTPQPSEKPKPIKSKPPPPEEESDEEDDEDESEDEDEKEEKKSSPLPLTQKNSKEDSSSDEEDESDSSDEDAEKNQKGSEKPMPGDRIEPVVPVPIRPKSNSKPVAKPVQAGQGNQSKKRPVSPVAAEKVAKRAKGGGKEEEVGKKVPRIWSEEDEIVLLEGVLEFQRKNGVSVSSDPGRFHETVKDKFSMNVDKTLWKEKLRRLKDKYNRMKGSEGKSPDVSKPHDGRCFELFNRIWGDRDVAGNNNGDGSESVKKKAVCAVTPGKSGKKGSANGSNAVVGMKATGVGNDGNVSRDGEDVPPRKDRPELTGLYPHLMRALKSREGIVGSGVMLSSIGVLGESELKGLDDRWKKMTKTELQLHMKEMDRRKEETDLLKEQANLVFSAMKF